jgi:hypothetical protein
MDADAKKWDLLYVSNSYGTTGATVAVYRYWKRKPVGVLTGFKQPFGECVDAAGNVYVTDYGARKIFEFKHGGTSPVKVISEAWSPMGCAVDPTTGNLAVANIGSDNGGSLAIYQHAKGKPTIYTSPLGNYASCAYDDHGNLLTTNGYDGSNQYGSSFAWLAKGSDSLTPITISGGTSTYGESFNDVHGIAWDGKYWVINGVGINELSRVTIAHLGGHVAGTTFIYGPHGQMGPVAIYNTSRRSQGTQAVGTVAYVYPEVLYWRYPSGGQPVAEITNGFSQPMGIAISLKQTPR